MPKLVEEITDAYEKRVGRQVKAFDTPGTPGVTLTKHEGDPVDIEGFRSIVGKYMYLVTKIFPEGGNTARELTRHFSNPGELHWKELDRVVGFLKHHKNDVYLVYRKPKDLRVAGNVDTNYATNPDDRRSVTGAFHTLGGMLTSWICKTQSGTMLSSTEAEYHGCTTAVQEMVFQQSLLKELGEAVLPGLILEDNMGAIFLVRNQAVGQRTKHIDIRAHWLREHYENGAFEILHTQGDHNESDIATKNTAVATHKKHSKSVRDGKMYVRENWELLMQELKNTVERRGIKSIDRPMDIMEEASSDWKTVK